MSSTPNSSRSRSTSALDLVGTRAVAISSAAITSPTRPAGVTTTAMARDASDTTAASSKRQSFGCGKDSPITEFSKAFYLDALRQTRSFPQAARLATQIVHETERAQKRKHSYPQMRLGAALEDPLRAFEQRLANGTLR